MILRRYKSSDCNAIISLFRETVHTVNRKDYTRDQCDAWAPAEIDVGPWDALLSSHLTLVAVEGETIVGFADMDETGYLDHLYVMRASCDAALRLPSATRWNRRSRESSIQRMLRSRHAPSLKRADIPSSKSSRSEDTASCSPIMSCKNALRSRKPPNQMKKGEDSSGILSLFADCSIRHVFFC